MAIIPGEIAQTGQQTPTARALPIETGDLGLGQVANVLNQIAEGKRKTAEVQAQTALVSARSNFDPAFKQAAETYDGYEPGFAQQQVSAWDDHVAEVRKGLSEDAALAFDQANLQERLRVVDQAAGVESSASGEIVKRQRAADVNARVSATATQFLVDTQTAAQEAFTSGDPTSPDFVKGQLASIDARMKSALETARPEDRPALQAQLANQRADAMVSFSTSSRQLLAARVVSSTKEGVGALVNRVNADPSFLDEAIRRAPTLLTGLPADVRQSMTATLPGDLAAAALTGLRDREDYHGLQAKLDDPRFKKLLSPEQYSRFAQIAKTALTSEQRNMAMVTVDQRLDAELASLRETGVSTGFDPSTILQALGPTEGPAQILIARQKIADAQGVYQAIGDAPGLTTKDLSARLDLLKPVPGDKDFKRKQEQYAQAVDVAGRLITLRQTDPALAVQADKTSAALWRETGDGSPATAQAWASDVLSRQERLGVPASQQAVLPVAEAKRLVKSVAVDDPISKAQAMTNLYGYAQRFGPNSGRVLMELQRNGLLPAEAAVINAVDADPIVVGSYTRALVQAPLVKVSPSQKIQLDNAVAKAMKPLLSSYGGSQDGLAYANALTYAVGQMARANMAGDQHPDEAAKTAARNFVGRYIFDDRNGYRIPVTVAAGKVSAVPGLMPADPKQADAVYTIVQREEPKKDVDRAYALQLGSYRTVRDLIAEDGKGLGALPGQPAVASGDRKKQYATQVGWQGKWVSTENDDGLMLMIPSPQGGLTAVFGADGKPVVRTWNQLFTRAGRP